MAYYGSIEVIDAENWSRLFSLDKARVMVGSAPFNDLLLSEERGSGVYPAHLQLFHSPVDPNRLRVVNLVNQPVVIQKRTRELVSPIPPNATGILEDGDVITLGSFSLIINMQTLPGVVLTARGEYLGMKLELPELELRPESSITGRLLVSNCGEQNHCQFVIDLDGLPPECYRIDPAPLLYPGGEEYLQISFLHRGFQPTAGACTFFIRATAPFTYPTEALVIEGRLDVKPHYGFALLIDDGMERSGIAAPSPILSSVPKPQVEAARGLHDSVEERAGQSTLPAPTSKDMIEPVPDLPLPLLSEDVPLTPPAPPADVLQDVSQPSKPEEPLAVGLPEKGSSEDETMPPVEPAMEIVKSVEDRSIGEEEGDLVEGAPDEAEDDWWSEAAVPVAKATSVDPAARLGQVKRHGLRPGENVPVLRAQTEEEENYPLDAVEEEGSG